MPAKIKDLAGQNIISFSIPGVPQGKARPRFRTIGGHVQTYTPETTREYEARVKQAYISATGGKITIPAGSAVQIEITAIMPVPKSLPKYKKAQLYGAPHISKPDADNIAKAIIDGINGTAVNDDSQFFRVAITKQYATVGCCARADVNIFTHDKL